MQVEIQVQRKKPVVLAVQEHQGMLLALAVQAQFAAEPQALA